MSTSLVITFVAPDRPGLVECLARAVSEADGNWLESRMAQLAGQFAGIVRVTVPETRVQTLRAHLETLAQDGIRAALHPGGTTDAQVTPARRLYLGIVGPDRPGIVREVSAALGAAGINVMEMDTRVTSAPMSAESLFEAEAEIHVPRDLDLAALNTTLDDICERLDIEIDLEETLRG